MQQHFTIIGTGLYLPPRRLTAEDIDRRAGLPDGWTRKHAGVLNRHECTPPETLASMALEAIGQALREAALDWSDLDLLIDGSTCRHQPIPCNAAYLQHARGPSAAGVPCMDIHSTCLGFILSLHAANALLATGMYRHIMLVCSETALKGVNWREPESACLMGDGAAAVLLRRTEPGPTYHFATRPCRNTWTPARFAAAVSSCRRPPAPPRPNTSSDSTWTAGASCTSPAGISPR